VVFEADVTDLWTSHVLAEGQATGVFPIEGLPGPMTALATALLERHAALRR